MYLYIQTNIFTLTPCKFLPFQAQVLHQRPGSLRVLEVLLISVVVSWIIWSHSLSFGALNTRITTSIMLPSLSSSFQLPPSSSLLPSVVVQHHNVQLGICYWCISLYLKVPQDLRRCMYAVYRFHLLLSTGLSLRLYSLHMRFCLMW